MFKNFVKNLGGSLNISIRVPRARQGYLIGGFLFFLEQLKAPYKYLNFYYY